VTFPPLGRAAWLCLAAGIAAHPAELKPRTAAAFEQYIRTAEARMDEQLRAGREFLWIDAPAERKRAVQRGDVATVPTGSSPEISVPGGLIHDWIGTVFIPGTTLGRTLALVQDYDNHKNIYRPEVVDSKLRARAGNDFKIYLRLLKKKVLTVVLNTEHDVHYFPVDAQRCYSRSYSTRIAEVDGAGSPGESERPPGEGHGFLWRLNSYWKFQERDGGVYVECRAISLTRDVPTGLGWLIEPIIRTLPRDSLANTLRATRAALAR
jgi:hypothetical protein